MHHADHKRNWGSGRVGRSIATLPITATACIKRGSTAFETTLAARFHLLLQSPGDPNRGRAAEIRTLDARWGLGGGLRGIMAAKGSGPDESFIYIEIDGQTQKFRASPTTTVKVCACPPSEGTSFAVSVLLPGRCIAPLELIPLCVSLRFVQDILPQLGGKRLYLDRPDRVGMYVCLCDPAILRIGSLSFSHQAWPFFEHGYRHSRAPNCRETAGRQ